MNTVSVYLLEKLWQDLVSLGDREKTSPDDLLQQAVRHFLREKQAAASTPGITGELRHLEGS